MTASRRHSGWNRVDDGGAMVGVLLWFEIVSQEASNYVVCVDSLTKLKKY